MFNFLNTKPKYQIGDIVDVHSPEGSGYCGMIVKIKKNIICLFL